LKLTEKHFCRLKMIKYWIFYLKKEDSIQKIIRKGRVEFRKVEKWNVGQRWLRHLPNWKDIVMAVKEGGPNPEANSRLRAVIQTLMLLMPKDK
jgi:hypothetical protein